MYIFSEIRGKKCWEDEFDTSAASDGFAEAGDYIIMAFSAEIEATHALIAEGKIKVPVFEKTFREGLLTPEKRTVIGPFKRTVEDNRFNCDSEATKVISLIRERSKQFVENPVSTNTRRLPMFRVVK